MIIFDSNVVLVDSEPLAATLLSKEFMHAGFALTPGVVAHFFTGSRPADIFATV
jgi:beta-phosphoglucomutase-like phosphatase (HAD superfamily)